MLEFDVNSDLTGLVFDAYARRPADIQAVLMDRPFAVTQGEWYYSQFLAGDYLCLGPKGLYGMTPEHFHAEYERRVQVDYKTTVNYRASFAEDGSVLLEPIE